MYRLGVTQMLKRSYHPVLTQPWFVSAIWLLGRTLVVLSLGHKTLLTMVKSAILNISVITQRGANIPFFIEASINTSSISNIIVQVHLNIRDT